MKSIYPVGLVLEGRACLVVGSSDELSWRVEQLLAAGAIIDVVCVAPAPALEARDGHGTIRIHRRAYKPADLDGKWLAVLADRDAALATRIAADAEARRVLFCAVDDPSRSSFWHLAIARAGPVVAAIGTGAAAPALARRLREELQRCFDEADFATFATRIAALRDRTPSADRREVLARALSGLKLGALELPSE